MDVVLRHATLVRKCHLAYCTSHLLYTVMQLRKWLGRWPVLCIPLTCTYTTPCSSDLQRLTYSTHTTNVTRRVLLVPEALELLIRLNIGVEQEMQTRTRLIAIRQRNEEVAAWHGMYVRERCIKKTTSSSKRRFYNSAAAFGSIFSTTFGTF